MLQWRYDSMQLGEYNISLTILSLYFFHFTKECAHHCRQLFLAANRRQRKNRMFGWVPVPPFPTKKKRKNARSIDHSKFFVHGFGWSISPQLCSNHRCFYLQLFRTTGGNGEFFSREQLETIPKGRKKNPLLTKGLRLARSSRENLGLPWFDSPLSKDDGSCKGRQKQNQRPIKPNAYIVVATLAPSRACSHPRYHPTWQSADSTSIQTRRWDTLQTGCSQMLSQEAMRLARLARTDSDSNRHFGEEITLAHFAWGIK